MRGSVDDIVYILFAVFGTALIMLVFAFVTFSFNDEIQANPNFDATTKGVINDLTYSGFDLLYNLLPFALIGMYIIALIFASKVNANPLFFPLSLFLGGVVIIFSSVLGYVYTEFASQSVLLTVTARYPAVDFIFSNYAFISVILMAGMFAVLYTKKMEGQKV